MMSRQLSQYLQKKTATVITGGSSGIGRCFITHLTTYKPDLWVCNLSRSEPKDFSKSLNFRHLTCDLADPLTVDRVIPEVISAVKAAAPEGEILLINNSGFGSYGVVQQQDPARQLAMVDVNVRSLVALTLALLPLLQQRGGAIVNIASTASFQPTPWMATYGATKAFVQSWTLGLHEDLRGTQVRALCVCPGPTETAFFGNSGFGGKKIPGRMSADAVVEASLQALAADRALIINGLRNRLTVGLARMVPVTVAARVARWVLATIRA